MIDPFREMKRQYENMDDADSPNRNNFVPSQSFTEPYKMLSGKLFSRGPITKCKLLNGTDASFRRALISNNCHLCLRENCGQDEKKTEGEILYFARCFYRV